MKYAISKEERIQRTNPISAITSSPFFGYIVLILVLAVFQIVFMTTDFITLTISRAIAQTIIYTIAAMGLGILLGVAGLTSLGTSAFIGFGAYLAGDLMKYTGIPYSAIAVIVLVAGALIGVVIGFVSLRATGVHLLIITFAISVVLQEIYNRPNKFTNGPDSLTRVPGPNLFKLLQLKRDTTFFLLLAVLLVMIILTANIINSPTGRAMLSMSSSTSLAQAMGISILKYRVLAFIIATEYALLAGMMYISYIGSSTANTWTVTMSLNILCAIVLGGGVKPSSAIIGSFIIFGLDLAVLKNLAFFQQNPQASPIFNGLLMIFIVIVYPGGLTMLIDNIGKRFKTMSVKRREYKYGK